MMLRDDVGNKLGKVVEDLDNLDIRLSNHYVGDGGRNDRAVDRVRGVINKALQALHSKNWIGAINKIE